MRAVPRAASGNSPPTELPNGSLELDLKVSHCRYSGGQCGRPSSFHFDSPELEGAVLRWAGDVEVVTPGKLRDRMRVLGDAHAAAHR
jgi:hypothetical protein